jgi:hypothetical protein
MVREFAVFLFYFGVLLAFLGALGHSNELMAVGMLAAAFGYGLRDYFSVRPDSITPMTINALFLGVWMGLGHLIACFVVGTQYEETFYHYAVMDFLLEAQYLATLTVLVPLVSYRWFTRLNVGPRRLLIRVPTVAFEVSDRTLLIFCLAMFVCDWTSKVINFPLESLGVLGTFISRSSEIAIFLLAWHWLGPSPTLPKWTRWVLYLGIAFDVSYSTMFSYMRGEIAYPLFTFFLAYVLRKAVSKRVVAIACVVIFAFASIYKIIGDTRGEGIRGSERIAIIIEQYLSNPSDVNQAREEEGGDSALMSLIARGCNSAQLSQVVRIADEEGYYYGKTLEYLSYAFIPRLIWPEKPSINPGQWFAEKIGRGTRLTETRFSNAINMSVAGELYLNFGWIGAVSGLILMGFLYAIFWESTDFYGMRNNPTGQGLGIAILLQAITGSSAGAILQLIFLYLSMLAISRVLIIFARRRSAIRTPNIRPVVSSGVTGG